MISLPEDDGALGLVVHEVDQGLWVQAEVAERDALLGERGLPVRPGRRGVVVVVNPAQSGWLRVEGRWRGPVVGCLRAPADLGILVVLLHLVSELRGVVPRDVHDVGAVAHAASEAQRPTAGVTLERPAPVESDEEGQDARVDQAGGVVLTANEVVRLFALWWCSGLAHE